MVLCCVIFGCFAAVEFLIFVENDFSLDEFVCSLECSIDGVSCVMGMFKSVESMTEMKDGLIRLILLGGMSGVIGFK